MIESQMDFDLHQLDSFDTRDTQTMQSWADSARDAHAAAVDAFLKAHNAAPTTHWLLDFPAEGTLPRMLALVPMNHFGKTVEPGFCVGFTREQMKEKFPTLEL